MYTLTIFGKTHQLPSRAALDMSARAAKIAWPAEAIRARIDARHFWVNGSGTLVPEFPRNTERN